MLEQVGGLGVDLERVLIVKQIEIEPVVRHLVHCNTNGYEPLAAGDFARLSRQSVVDDNSDDNRDDSYCLNDGIYSLNSLLSCLVRDSARSWQCGGRWTVPSPGLKLCSTVVGGCRGHAAMRSAQR